METLQNIFQMEIIQRLGWTLVHFVWQGTAIALVLAIALKLLRKSSANLRYTIGCMALLLIVLMPAITIRMIGLSVPAFDPVKLNQAAIDRPEFADVLAAIEMPQAELPAAVTPRMSLKDRFIEIVEPVLPYVVVGWLVGVFGLSLWHLGGWTQLQRLRRQMVKQVAPTLKAKFQQLSNMLGIQKTIGLVESALVQVPTVVGHLKPVILLPASALTGLSSEQIEAILAHELAHIKRCDYLVNILQTVVEILGFYHPAVWWISGKIRVERENCCDDIAISLCSDSLCYAKALTTMEEIRFGQPALAVAASGGSLFDRIRRLLGKDSANKVKISWLPSATAILLIMTLIIPTVFALNYEKSEGVEYITKQRLQQLVEDFFKNNYRDITARKTMEWGEPAVDADGNTSIRYKYEATIWDKDKIITDQLFVFDKEEKILSFDKISPFSIGSRQWLQEKVEEFFNNNYRDITARKTLEWSDPISNPDDTYSIRYKYEATIWGKDKIVEDKLFSFDKNGKFVSARKLNQNKADAKSDRLRIYQVNRNVSDFPETEDFSTPEAAYAAINRVMADDDHEGWQRVSIKSLAESLEEGAKVGRGKKVDPEWSKVVLNAHILEVRIKDEKAVVIAKLPQEHTNKRIKHPIDYRHLVFEDGKWLNNGEDRYDTIEQARAKFIKTTEEELRMKQEYRDMLDETDTLLHLAVELFDGLRAADYEKVLSYYNERTGKWRWDGWKKLGLDYMVQTDWPSFALWVCRTFKDNPIELVELGDIFISDKEMHETLKAPAVPYRLVLKDGRVLDGDLYFYYWNRSGKWQAAEGIDWHLQKNPIKRSAPQILTSAYILSVPADLPQLKGIISDYNSKAKMITPRELQEFLKVIDTTPGARMIAAPKLLTNDGEVGQIRTEDDEGLESTKLKIKNKVGADRKTVKLEIGFEYRFVEGENQTVKTVSSTVSALSGHAFAIACGGVENGQMVILLIKAEILEEPSSKTGVVQTENPFGQIEDFKRQLQEPVSVHIEHSPDNDTLTVQYVIMAVCKTVNSLKRALT